MKQFLLATTLIVIPTVIFSAGYLAINPNGSSAVAVAADPLGDLSSYQPVVDALQTSVSANDWTAAKTQAAELETKWDGDQPSLQPMDGLAWGNVDSAIDAVLHDIRADAPDQAKTVTDLDALTASLSNPSGDAASGAGAGGVTQVMGIDVTDANGHAIPCETLLKEVEAGLASANLSQDVTTKINDLQAKATERCNADDDKRSDAFSAEALSLIKSAS